MCRKEITFTSSRFSRMPLCLPVRYIPSGMRLAGNSPNHFGIFRETCQVYFLTAPYNKFILIFGIAFLLIMEYVIERCVLIARWRFIKYRNGRVVK